jgi:peptide/nickel transport system ATP-binding protein
MVNPLLTVDNLHVHFADADRLTHAVRGVSWTLGRERLGIVGESGSGKSATARALLGLVRAPGYVQADQLRLGDIDLQQLSARQWSSIRGPRMAMVMQDPRHALNPVQTIGQQIAESFRLHGGHSRKNASQLALSMLESVHITDPERVARSYPRQISGGMGQRAMIALMLAAEPEILIADEPTSALDAAVQNQVLALLDEQIAKRGMGLIFISHDLDLVSRFCDRVLVMYAGQVVESLPATQLDAAQHPYTKGLSACVPRLGSKQPSLPVFVREPAWEQLVHD